MNLRRYISCLSVLVVLLIIQRHASAQSRIAYVDAMKLLKQLPEAMDAESHLNQFVSQWNKEVADFETELNRKRVDYDRKKLIMSDAERSAAELDISELRKRIDQYRQTKYGPNGELATQQEGLMKPAYDKLLKAIEDVALESKYDYIFDKSSKEIALLYTNAKFDLTNAVAKKLGLETNDIFSVPLINNTKQQQQPNMPPPDQRGQPQPPPQTDPSKRPPIQIDQQAQPH